MRWTLIALVAAVVVGGCAPTVKEYGWVRGPRVQHESGAVPVYIVRDSAWKADEIQCLSKVEVARRRGEWALIAHRVGSRSYVWIQNRDIHTTRESAIKTSAVPPALLQEHSGGKWGHGRRIKPGMTERQVRALMGKPGHVEAMADSAGWVRKLTWRYRPESFAEGFADGFTGGLGASRHRRDKVSAYVVWFRDGRAVRVRQIGGRR